MQLCHEPAPLRKARRIDSEKRSILTELAARWCGKLMDGKQLLLGEHGCDLEGGGGWTQESTLPIAGLFVASTLSSPHCERSMFA